MKGCKKCSRAGLAALHTNIIITPVARQHLLNLSFPELLITKIALKPVTPTTVTIGSLLINKQFSSTLRTSEYHPSRSSCVLHWLSHAHHLCVRLRLLLILLLIPLRLLIVSWLLLLHHILLV